MARVVPVRVSCWRLRAVSPRGFRHGEGTALRRDAFQWPFHKSGTDTGSVRKGGRWPLVKELSTSVKVMQYDLTKSDLAKSGYRKLLFDTHAMTQLLEESGFTIQQAEVIVKVLLNTTDSNMDIMYGDMVTKTQQEIMLQKIMSHIAAVKKDMIILEKSEFSALLEENDRIKVELAQVTMQLSDLMDKVCLDNKLDMNLEKSQVKEMKAEHEKKILEARNHMLEMLAEQDRHVTQSKMKIDTEVAGLKTMLESHKLDSIKYLAECQCSQELLTTEKERLQLLQDLHDQKKWHHQERMGLKQTKLNLLSRKVELQRSVFTCLTVVLGFYRIWM